MQANSIGSVIIQWNCAIKPERNRQSNVLEKLNERREREEERRQLAGLLACCMMAKRESIFIQFASNKTRRTRRIRECVLMHCTFSLARKMLSSFRTSVSRYYFSLRNISNEFSILKTDQCHSSSLSVRRLIASYFVLYSTTRVVVKSSRRTHNKLRNEVGVRYKNVERK